MAIGDPPYPWPWVTNAGGGNCIGTCNHGTPNGSPCFYCQHPALGPAAPQTFQLGGWRCPGCGTCWNPSVLACHRCPQQTPVGIGEGFTDPATHACPEPTEGGMCGCGEDGDGPVNCTGGRHCAC